MKRGCSASQPFGKLTRGLSGFKVDTGKVDLLQFHILATHSNTAGALCCMIFLGVGSDEKCRKKGAMRPKSALVGRLPSRKGWDEKIF